MVTCRGSDVSPDMSFLEMLDVLNEDPIGRGDAFTVRVVPPA